MLLLQVERTLECKIKAKSIKAAVTCVDYGNRKVDYECGNYGIQLGKEKSQCANLWKGTAI
jgi:hypothetical protein